MKYIIDSSAWIEYLQGSSAGEKVNTILNNNNEIISIPLIIAEVISKVKRNNENVELAYESITNNTKIFEITPRIAKEAGVLYAMQKQKNSSFSLADAIIICTANHLDTTVVTKDLHFKQFDNVILI